MGESGRGLGLEVTSYHFFNIIIIIVIVIIVIVIFLLATYFSLDGKATEPTIFQHFKANLINILFHGVDFVKD